jgi:serine/threonine protein kinase
MNAGQRVDRYILEKQLSSNGGMSSVWIAHIDSETKNKVVIKIAKTDKNNTSHEDALLRWEADHLKIWDWRHPGVVRIIPTPLRGNRAEYTLKATELKDQPWYMVMEYLRGKSITDNKSIIQKYSLEWKLELFYQILVVVGFLHQKGFAHRDIKPDNIVFRDILTSPALLPQPVLIDFALVSDGKTQRETIDNSYTLEYASPERILRAMDYQPMPKYDVLAEDIWSLGVLFYEILTGNPLFKGNRESIRTTLVNNGLLAVELPKHDERYKTLTHFIMEMLNKNPDKRPQVKSIIMAMEELFIPPRITGGS